MRVCKNYVVVRGPSTYSGIIGEYGWRAGSRIPAIRKPTDGDWTTWSYSLVVIDDQYRYEKGPILPLPRQLLSADATTIAEALLWKHCFRELAEADRQARQKRYEALSDEEKAALEVLDPIVAVARFQEGRKGGAFVKAWQAPYFGKGGQDLGDRLADALRKVGLHPVWFRTQHNGDSPVGVAVVKEDVKTAEAASRKALEPFVVQGRQRRWKVVWPSGRKDRWARCEFELE